MPPASSSEDGFLVPKAVLGLRRPETHRLCHPPTHSLTLSRACTGFLSYKIPSSAARQILTGRNVLWLCQSMQEASDPELFKGRLVEYPRGGGCHSTLYPTSLGWLFLTGSARQSWLLGLSCPGDRGRLSNEDRIGFCWWR